VLCKAHSLCFAKPNKRLYKAIFPNALYFRLQSLHPHFAKVMQALFTVFAKSPQNAEKRPKRAAFLIFTPRAKCADLHRLSACQHPKNGLKQPFVGKNRLLKPYAAEILILRDPSQPTGTVGQ